MVKVNVVKLGNYPVSAKKIKDAVSHVLTQNGIVSDCEVSVAIAGNEKMAEYVHEYMGKDEEASIHPVLSFPSSETQGVFIFPPDGKLHLGEIVISYPFSVDESKKTGQLIDDVVVGYAEHGALHLIGIHHD